jgi:hypothetical protein
MVRIFWIFGSVWKFFDTFDLDGHNLGTALSLCLLLFQHSNVMGSDCQSDYTLFSCDWVFYTLPV